MMFNSPLLLTFTTLVAAAVLPAVTLAGRNSDILAKTDSPTSSVTTPLEAAQVVSFWREAGPAMWFAKDETFDKQFRERFLSLHEAASRRELSDWLDTSDGALALIILLDQFPRNAFRGTARMYATDALAIEMATAAIAAGHDRALPNDLALFVYLPFGHSESLSDQERSVALARRLGARDMGHAEHHRDIIRRFGRFPHRNPLLGRTMRPEEQAYLDEGGYKG